MTGPTTPILDNFNSYPTGTELNTGNWAVMVFDGNNNVWGWDGNLVNAGNMAGHQDWGESGSMWNTLFGPNTEVYFTFTADMTQFSEMYIPIKMTGTGVSTGSKGYYVYFYTSDQEDIFRIYRSDPGVGDILLASFNQPIGITSFQNGYKFMAEYKDGVITLYKCPVSIWTSFLTVTDNTYLLDTGYIGVCFRKIAQQIDDFGGGTQGGGVTPPPDSNLFTRTIRWVRSNFPFFQFEI